MIIKPEEMDRLFVHFERQMGDPSCELACSRHAQSLLNYVAYDRYIPTDLHLNVLGQDMTVTALQKPTHERTYLVVSGVPGLLVNSDGKEIRRMIWGKWNPLFALRDTLKLAYEENYGILSSDNDWFIHGITATLKELIGDSFEENDFRVNVSNYDSYRGKHW
jgi:hypothetical protein